MATPSTPAEKLFQLSMQAEQEGAALETRLDVLLRYLETYVAEGGAPPSWVKKHFDTLQALIQNHPDETRYIHARFKRVAVDIQSIFDSIGFQPQQQATGQSRLSSPPEQSDALLGDDLGLDQGDVEAPRMDTDADFYMTASWLNFLALRIEQSGTADRDVLIEIFVTGMTQCHFRMGSSRLFSGFSWKDEAWTEGYSEPPETMVQKLTVNPKIKTSGLSSQVVEIDANSGSRFGIGFLGSDHLLQLWLLTSRWHASYAVLVAEVLRLMEKRVSRGT